VSFNPGQFKAEEPKVEQFKPIGNIDKLIRTNIKKMKEKEAEQKENKKKSEEDLKKRREDLLHKNEQVRKLNRTKIYKKRDMNHQGSGPEECGENFFKYASNELTN